MHELVRPALVMTARTSLFLTATVWVITRLWVVEWTGEFLGRPVAVATYDKGVVATYLGLESVPWKLVVTPLDASFDPRTPSENKSLLRSLSPSPGPAFLWAGPTVLGYRHQFALTILGLLNGLLWIDVHRRAAADYRPAMENTHSMATQAMPSACQNHVANDTPK